jgi:hypothetical protein
MNVILISVGIIAIVMLAMAVGVLLRGKCLSGSCGGQKVVGAGGKLTCGTCGRHGEPDSEPESERIEVSGTR